MSTIDLMDTGSLLGLVTARSVRILLECFLVFREVFTVIFIPGGGGCEKEE